MGSRFGSLCKIAGRGVHAPRVRAWAPSPKPKICANHIRPTSITYPDSRVISLDYGAAGGMDDVLSRIQAIKDGALELAKYTRLGQAAVVQVDYTEPDVCHDLITGSGDDPYDGFDRFDRIVDNLWRDYGSSTDAARIKYGYDRAGNRTYRENPVDTGDNHDEHYAYDGLHRLKDFDRGALNAGKTAISTLKFAQEWSLDPTGNWSGFKQDDNGDTTWNLDQSRTSNKVNEITAITETTGPAWADPAYDKAGNMTGIPQPADPTQTYTGTYNAWNRLVKLTDGANTVQENEYDGLGRRIIKKKYTGGVLDETRHHYFSLAWQALEERVDASTDPDRQFIWGLRYLDDLICRDRDTTADGILDERLYALQDANWNVTALVDTAGDVQERCAYDAYGKPLFLDASFASRSSSSYNWETLLSGYRWDVYTRLFQVRNRMYHARLGIWLTRDPVGFEPETNYVYQNVDDNPVGFSRDPMNLYNYCWNSPAVNTDPSGLRPCVRFANLVLNPLTFGYGCYCGWKRTGGDPRKGLRDSLDALDEACRIHDICLEGFWDFINPIKQLVCNRNLCLAAISAKYGTCRMRHAPGRRLDQCLKAAGLMIGFYCIVLRTGGVASHEISSPLLLSRNLQQDIFTLIEFESHSGLVEKNQCSNF